jgi:glutathione S-transferase
VAVVRGGLDARYPALTEWLARIHARPAYQRALKNGGAYTILR